MGTIGDQFADLAALFGGEGEAPPKTSSTSSDDFSEPSQANGRESGETLAHDAGVVAGRDDAPGTEGEGGDDFQSVLIATICELNGMSDADFDLDADLERDLDMQGLPLWALVAELERFAGATFADPVVRAWKTPRDILTAGPSSER